VTWWSTVGGAALSPILAIVLYAQQPSAQVPMTTNAVDPRLTEAIAWYTGTAGRVDDGRAQALLLEAAADDDPVSVMWLARCHSRGRMRFERDAAKANALASRVVGEIVRLAHAEVAEAVFLMGTAYDEGLGVPVDPPLAAAWFHRAADLGHLLAEHNLGNAYADGRGVPQSDSMAIYWWRRPAEAGDAVPQFRLARMYEDGRGSPKDPQLALQWYRRSAGRGYAPAREALTRLGEKW
jgi:TPR repeat protein